MSEDPGSKDNQRIDCVPTNIVCKRNGKSGYFYKCGSELVCFIDKEVASKTSEVETFTSKNAVQACPVVIQKAQATYRLASGGAAISADAVVMQNGPEDWYELRPTLDPAADPRRATKFATTGSGSGVHWYYSARYRWVLLDCAAPEIVIESLTPAATSVISVERADVDYKLKNPDTGTSPDRNLFAVSVLKGELPVSPAAWTQSAEIRGVPTGVTCKLGDKSGQYFHCGDKWVCLVGDLESQPEASVEAGPANPSNPSKAPIEYYMGAFTYKPMNQTAQQAQEVQVFRNAPDGWRGDVPEFESGDPMDRALRTRFTSTLTTGVLHLYYLRDVGWFFLPTDAPFADISGLKLDAPGTLPVLRETFRYSVKVGETRVVDRKASNAQSIKTKPVDFPSPLP